MLGAPFPFRLIYRLVVSDRSDILRFSLYGVWSLSPSSVWTLPPKLHDQTATMFSGQGDDLIYDGPLYCLSTGIFFFPGMIV